MTARGYLGSFELMVLLAIIHLGDAAYGVTIAREIEARTRRDVVRRSVYAALDRLQDKGYVRSRLGAPTPERGGRAKRYFQATAHGSREARSTQQALSTLWLGPPALEGETA
jgi:DNA-binding PadR family transcriptional regulator